MFEFGRDLRKLFAQARESEDLGWVELIGPDLLRAEALREPLRAALEALGQAVAPPAPRLVRPIATAPVIPAAATTRRVMFFFMIPLRGISICSGQISQVELAICARINRW